MSLTVPLTHLSQYRSAWSCTTKINKSLVEGTHLLQLIREEEEDGDLAAVIVRE